MNLITQRAGKNLGIVLCHTYFFLNKLAFSPLHSDLSAAPCPQIRKAKVTRLSFYPAH